MLPEALPDVLPEALSDVLPVAVRGREVFAHIGQASSSLVWSEFAQ